MVSLQDVTVKYKKGELVALDSVSLDIKSGEVVAILGPNGAGKTTLIKTICGLIMPHAGEATVRGINAIEKPEEAREHIGMLLYPERSFYYRLSGEQNLRFFASMQGIYGRKARSKIRELLERFDLWEQRKLPFMKYSLGMRKKLALARALINEPPVLLLDEPTDNLDPVATREILALVEKLRQDDKAVIFATHRLDEAEKVADQAAFLKDGQLVAYDSLNNLRTRVKEKSLVIGTTEKIHNTELLSFLSSKCLSVHLDENLDTLYMTLSPERIDISGILEMIRYVGYEVDFVSFQRVSLDRLFHHLIA